jgi:hypothetical protein
VRRDLAAGTLLVQGDREGLARHAGTLKEREREGMRAYVSAENSIMPIRISKDLRNEHIECTCLAFQGDPNTVCFVPSGPSSSFASLLDCPAACWLWACRLQNTAQTGNRDGHKRVSLAYCGRYEIKRLLS